MPFNDPNNIAQLKQFTRYIIEFQKLSGKKISEHQVDILVGEFIKAKTEQAEKPKPNKSDAKK